MTTKTASTHGKHTNPTEIEAMTTKTASTHANHAESKETEAMTTKTHATHAKHTNHSETEAMTTKTATPSTTDSSSTAASTTTATKASPSNASLAALVAELSAALDAAEEKMGDAPTLTTASQKRRRGKPRRGGDKVIAQLAPIVKQYGLESASLNSDDMVARNQTAQTLVPLQARLQKVSKRVDDEVFGAQTDAWDMGLQFYSLLKRRGKSDGNVAKSIEPLAKSFSYRNPKVKEGKPTKQQTKVKAQAKKVLAAAQKHGVSVLVAPDGTASLQGAPQAMAAVQAELAGGSAPTGTSGQGGTGAGAAGTGGAMAALAPPLGTGNAGSGGQGVNATVVPGGAAAGTATTGAQH